MVEEKMYDGPLNWPYVKASPATYRLMRLHCNIVATILEGWQAKGLQLEALTKRMREGGVSTERWSSGQPLAEPSAIIRALRTTIRGRARLPVVGAVFAKPMAWAKRVRPGSVLVDVAIDQGGCFETSRPTTHADPTYVVDGVVHYCIANMPGGAAHLDLRAQQRDAALRIGARRWRAEEGAA
jgi:hypothetical protein